jgi:predicted nucleic acid-binding protein
MTRFAIDAPVALSLAVAGVTVPAHQLVGPVTLRSDVLAGLYGQVRAGQLAEAEALRVLDRVTTARMRLLGDRVSRREAWRTAVAAGLADTHLAEYVAVARLQADVLVTEDPDLVRIAAVPNVPTLDWTQFVDALEAPGLAP